MTGEPDLFDSLAAVRVAALARESALAARLARMPAAQRPSARNLAHYLAARSFELRPVQRRLAELGLSSLGRSEAHLLVTLDAVLARVAVDAGRVVELPVDLGQRGPAPEDSHRLLDDHALAALGPFPARHHTRVMVTLPSEAATSPALIESLVAAGMSVARVNCAHDGPEAWRAMIANVRAAAASAGRDVRVVCDLAGPKLRTGPLTPDPGVIRVRPRRDLGGQVVEAAQVVLVPPGAKLGEQTGRVARVPVSGLTGPGELVVGDELRFTDARGRSRRLPVVADADGVGVYARADRACYLTEGTVIERRRHGTDKVRVRVTELPTRQSAIEVRAGDTLVVRCGHEPGGPAVRDEAGAVVSPAFVSVDIPELFLAARPGERVLIDDGKIVARVATCAPDRLELRVEHPERARIRAEKGINLPDTQIAVPALDADDLAALEVVAGSADMVALSFVSGPDDVLALHRELDRLGAASVGVVLKIEHARAFDALPEMLFAALERPPAAVMVARGDLAVELGYGRLAEVQEEILWLCEAAHVPVIWATQVLDTLARTGTPTRAEVTDAAWASRAECVMLNKGPYITDAVRLLDGILHRMGGHRDKRTPVWRPLSVADLTQ